MHDIALLLVRFNKFLFSIVFPLLKCHHLVQNVCLVDKSNVKLEKLVIFNLVMAIYSFYKIKVRLVTLKNPHFS